MMKRVSCDAGGKCAVFKAGLCIDLGKPVWSSTFNEVPKASKSVLSIQHGNSHGNKHGKQYEQAKKFGELAAALLKQHDNALPERYACSDTRHDWKVQRYIKKKKKFKDWRCYQKAKTGECRKTKDATLARFAILNF